MPALYLLLEFAYRHGTAEQIALCSAAAELFEENKLFVGLYALGERYHIELIGQGDDVFENGLGVGIVGETVEKLHIYLQHIKLVILEDI